MEPHEALTTFAGWDMNKQAEVRHRKASDARRVGQFHVYTPFTPQSGGTGQKSWLAFLVLMPFIIEGCDLICTGSGAAVFDSIARSLPVECQREGKNVMKKEP
eukprot:scaffold231857_cov21-Tisochrysis_lutea.AAC.1